MGYSDVIVQNIRRSRLAVAAFTVSALVGTVLLGGGAAWAYFTASAQATGQTTSWSVAITQVNFENLNQTYRNTHTTLTQTGSFTVTNTGQANGSVSVSISGPGGFLSNLPIQAWPLASAGACTADTTVPSNAASGTWGSTTVTSGTNLKAAASIVYCVRTTINPHTQRPLIATPSGTQSAQSTLSATLSASGWSANATAVNTQKTEGIYPLADSYLPTGQSRWYTIRSSNNENICLDASGGGSSDGTQLISWDCSDAANQRWQFMPVNGDDPTLVTIRPAHAPDKRATLDPQKIQSLKDPSSRIRIKRTYWYVQQVSSNRYMLVSREDGSCLNVKSRSSSARQNTIDCTHPDAILDLRREGLSFENGWAQFKDDTCYKNFPDNSGVFVHYYDPDKGEKCHPTGTFFFGFKIRERLHLQHRGYRGGKWVTGATAERGSDRIKIDTSKMNEGDEVRLVFSDGNVAYDGFVIGFDKHKLSFSGSDWTSLTLSISHGVS